MKKKNSSMQISNATVGGFPQNTVLVIHSVVPKEVAVLPYRKIYPYT